MLRFKRKGLVMEEICEGCHKGQVDALVVRAGVMVTAGGDKQMGYHRMGAKTDS
jgi:hypothetical protein